MQQQCGELYDSRNVWVSSKCDFMQEMDIAIMENLLLDGLLTVCMDAKCHSSSRLRREFIEKNRKVCRANAFRAPQIVVKAKYKRIRHKSAIVWQTRNCPGQFHIPAQKSSECFVYNVQCIVVSCHASIMSIMYIMCVVLQGLCA